MERATLTIAGLTICSTCDNNLWESFTVPDGMNKDLAIATILEKADCFQLLYPDFDVMKTAIARWTLSDLDIWRKMYKTETVEYDPIENYNRHEEYEDVSTGSTTGTSSGTADGSSTAKSAAFNSNELVTQSGSETNSSTSGESATDTQSRIVHSAHLYGNIGTVTTQSMIRQERMVADFCTYDFIAESFVNRFCIRVY